MESHTAAIIGILFVASLTASTFGFGVGLIAMPILAVMVDIKTASPLVGLVITTVIVGTDHVFPHMCMSPLMMTSS